MELYSRAHSLSYDEALPKVNKVITLTREQVDPLVYGDRLGCARGIFYAATGEILLAIVGLLMWRLFH